jgi:hypothetical protein
MVKEYDKLKWTAPDPEKRFKILKVLSDKDLMFDDILQALNELPTIPDKKNWNRQTLTVYLWVMQEDGWINHGNRKTPYSINKNSRDAMDALGTRVLFKGRANLLDLKTEQFIRDWRASLDFSFLNIVKDYWLLGKAEAKGTPKDKIQQITQAHINDMVLVIAEYGTTMVKQIKSGEMEEGEIAKAVKDLQEETKRQFPHM